MNGIGMQIVLKYFPGLSRDQINSFEKLVSIYRKWNAIINIVSPKDIETLYENHVLHSLAIAKIINFNPGSRILDVGTGGGFPGIPLAILFPLCRFTLVDSMQRRILVVQGVIETLKLKNVTTLHSRIEDEHAKFDFVISRAIAAFPKLVDLVKKNISCQSLNVLPNGILYLKGGSFEEEIIDFKEDIEVTEIEKFFPEPCFRSKKVIYLPVFELETQKPSGPLQIF
jgi:16S rRNA (guanine527-N7)-methyltransferase